MVHIEVNNSAGTPQRLTWDAYVFDMASREFHSIEMTDKNGTPAWDGRVSGPAVRKVELMTHDGPYLNAGSRVILVLCLRDQSGQALWLKTEQSQIGRTD